MSSGAAVIVGAGQAGLQTAESLRAGGWLRPVLLLGDEGQAPYHRPPLSKAWLAGEVEAAQLAMRAPAALQRKGIELRVDCPVRAIHRGRRSVELADGSELPYAGLVLATGARPRRLSLPGAEARGVMALRTLADARALADALRDCGRRGLPLAVIGGGFIGLEVAATARKLGLDVTVIEAGPRLLARALPAQLSGWYAELHRARGVRLEIGVAPSAVLSEGGEVVGLALADGRTLRAGLVLVGIGADPCDDLARAAGLECSGGVVVDACAGTADPAVFAVGDCAVRRLHDGSLLRLESVHNAVEQGKAAAAALLGRPTPCDGVPWFWSDQYGIKLQMAGLGAGADRMVRRGGAAAFSLFQYRDDRLVAVASVDAPQDHLAARRLIDGGITPSEGQVADAGFDLASLLSAP